MELHAEESQLIQGRNAKKIECIAIRSNCEDIDVEKENDKISGE